MLEGFTPWPEEFVERYRRKGYWEDRTIGDFFDEAVVGDEARLTYKVINSGAQKLQPEIKERTDKKAFTPDGEHISAEEIEQLILTHPSVKNVACVGMPDPVLGERICAYVILNPGKGLTLQELVSFLEGKGIARFKLPERLEIVEDFPMSNIGKVLKNKLREDIARKIREGC